MRAHEAIQQAADETASDPDTSDEDGLEVCLFFAYPLSDYLYLADPLQPR